MALTLIERVTKRYPRTGGTYVDMKYTEIKNPNFTVDVSKPPLTRIVDADFPDRYIIGYTRIVNDFGTTIDDIEPETMDMVVCNSVMVPESNPENLMLARYNGHCFIKAGDNYYLSLKSYQIVVSARNNIGDLIDKILEDYAGETVCLAAVDEQPFPFADHDWIQAMGAVTKRAGGPYTYLSTIVSLLGEFIEIPVDKLPTFFGE